MKIHTATTAQTPEALLNDLQNLVSDAVLLLNAAPDETSETQFALLLARLAAARQSVDKVYASAKQIVATHAKSVDATIRAHPYQALGVALGTGLILGLFLGGRGK